MGIEDLRLESVALIIATSATVIAGTCQMRRDMPAELLHFIHIRTRPTLTLLRRLGWTVGRQAGNNAFVLQATVELIQYGMYGSLGSLVQVAAHRLGVEVAE